MRSGAFAVAVFSLLLVIPSRCSARGRDDCGLSCQTRRAYNNFQQAISDYSDSKKQFEAAQDGSVDNRVRKVQEAEQHLVQSAQTYLQKEAAYQDRYGGAYNVDGIEGAQNVLSISATKSQQNQSEGDGAGGEEVDSRGVPIVGNGRKVSDNTKFTGEASGDVADLDGKDELGTTFTRDGFGQDPSDGSGSSASGSGGSDSSQSAGTSLSGELNTYGQATVSGNNTSGGSSVGLAVGRPARPQGSEALASEGRAGRRVKNKSTAAVREAETQLSMGSLPGALLAAERAIFADPRNPEGYALKAKVLNRMGRYQDAAVSAQAAQRLDPKHVPARQENAWAVLNTKDYNAALAAADRALRLDPNNASAYAIKAFAYEQLGDRKRMLASLKMAARLAPGQYRKYFERALAGERLFRPGEKDNWRLLDGAPYAGGAPRGVPSPVCIGAILIGLAGLIIAFLMRRRGSNARPAVESSIPAAAPGELIAGKYRMTRVIGKGGMGHIYEASDESLGRTVAIKKFIFDGISPDRARKSALREAQMIAQIRHPGIVDIIEVLDRPEGLFLVFELLAGKTVEQIILEKKQMPLADVKRVLVPVCAALEFAHSKGIIHRDLKPSNIMLTQEGYVKVMDFGIARRNQVAVPVGGASAGSGGALSAHTRSIAGTPDYMPPEAMKGEVSPASDVYSLGVCLYEMLTGELPLRPPNREYVPAALRVPGTAPQFDEMIRASLETDPKMRIPDVRTFAQRLEALPEKTTIG